MKTPKQHLREAEVILRAKVSDRIAKLNSENEKNIRLNLSNKNEKYNLN